MSKSEYKCYICRSVMTHKVEAAAKERQLSVASFNKGQQSKKDEIIVTCPEGHANLFEVNIPFVIENSDDSQEIIGSPPPEDYDKNLIDLRKQTSLENSLANLNNFGKWLFSSSSVIGVIAAGYSIAGFASLNFWGNIIFYLGLLLITVCLFISALALSPKEKNSNPNSLTSLRNMIEEIIHFKWVKLRAAGFLFAFAILFAGIAPLISILSSPAKAQYFRISNEILNDNVTVSISTKNISTKNPVEIGTQSYFAKQKKTINNLVEYPNSNGELNLKFSLLVKDKTFPFDSINVLAHWFNSNNIKKDTVYKIYNIE